MMIFHVWAGRDERGVACGATAINIILQEEANEKAFLHKAFLQVNRIP